MRQLKVSSTLLTKLKSPLSTKIVLTKMAATSEYEILYAMRLRNLERARQQLLEAERSMRELTPPEAKMEIKPASTVAPAAVPPCLPGSAGRATFSSAIGRGLRSEELLESVYRKYFPEAKTVRQRREAIKVNGAALNLRAKVYLRLLLRQEYFIVNGDAFLINYKKRNLQRMRRRVAEARRCVKTRIDWREKLRQELHREDVCIQRNIDVRRLSHIKNTRCKLCYVITPHRGHPPCGLCIGCGKHCSRLCWTYDRKTHHRGGNSRRSWRFVMSKYCSGCIELSRSPLMPDWAIRLIQR